MTKTFYLMTTALLILTLSGCYNDILDPTQIGRFEPTPVVNVILDTLGVADEPSPIYEGAEDPRPEDLIAYDQDYVLGSGDFVRISIFELQQVGQNYINDYVVTETGRISIPEVGLVSAAGLTESKLEQEIADILSPSILKNPSVTVTLLQSQSRLFSIMGQGVAQPSRFAIPRSTFRLTDAISQAGGIGDFNVSYVYVSRDVPKQDALPTTEQDSFNLETVEPDRKKLEEEMLEIITPSVHRKQNGLLITSAEMATRKELEALAAPEDIDSVEVLAADPLPAEELLPQQQKPRRIEWVFEDGKWKPVEIEGEPLEPSGLDPDILKPREFAQSQGQPIENIPSDFGLGDLGDVESVTRVIKIPRDRLESGDPRYNIIIRPGDRITVPRDVVGEFWIGGNVNGPGAYPLTGRPINLKQAIITASGLNQIAQPKKVEVVRRLGKNKAGLMQEEFVLVDLQKIAKGLQPDFFIKPNDQINVGTSGTSRWLAQLRNAFRATYGFGFIYDRNFASSDFDGDPFPGHFGFNSVF